MIRKFRIKNYELRIIRLFIILLLVYILFLIAKSFRNSIIIRRPDRVDIIYYGSSTALMSLGLSDGVNYIAFFDNDLKINVPGGYGRYRIGSLGKLAELEKKNSLIEKAFSSATSSYVDFYILPKKSPIFFEGGADEKDFYIPKLNILDVFLPLRFETDANFLDRLYLFLKLIDARKNEFLELNTNITVKGADKIFSEEDFARKYKGFFYQKSLREEEKNIQILFNDYNTAGAFARILEGEGINVVDLNTVGKYVKGCLLKTSDKKRSNTGSYLAERFNCRQSDGPTGGYDIIMYLGTDLEKEWEY